jgi:hypothetical protein
LAISLFSDTKLKADILLKLREAHYLKIISKELLLVNLYFPMQIEHKSPEETSNVPLGFQAN